VKREQVTTKQALFMLITLRMTTGALSLPVLTLTAKGSDAWMVPLLAFCAALPVILALVAIQSRFPAETLVQVAVRLTGPVLGGLFVLPVLCEFLFRSALALRQYADMMASGPMPETPGEAFIILVALFSAYIIRLGLEPGIRVIEVALPLAMLALLGLLALGVKEMDPKSLKPFLGEGWGPVLKPTPTIATLFISDVFPLVMLAPRLENPRQLVRVVLTSVAVSAAFIAIAAAVAIMFFSAPEARAQAFPLFSLARAITLADIIERLDAFYLMVITIMTTGQSILLFYCIAAGLAQWLRLQDYRPLVLPVSMLACAGALLLYEDRVEVTRLQQPQVAPFLLLLPTVGVMFLLFLVAWMSGARGKQPRTGRAEAGPGGENP
jgi:spore germination protein KB